MELDKTRPEDWLMVEDPIRYHISIIDDKYKPYLIEAALNEKLQTSNFDAAIGCTTVDNKSCKLFEVKGSEAWASVAYRVVPSSDEKN